MNVYWSRYFAQELSMFGFHISLVAPPTVKSHWSSIPLHIYIALFWLAVFVLHKMSDDTSMESLNARNFVPGWETLVWCGFRCWNALRVFSMRFSHWRVGIEGVVSVSTPWERQGEIEEVRGVLANESSRGIETETAVYYFSHLGHPIRASHAETNTHFCEKRLHKELLFAFFMNIGQNRAWKIYVFFFF